MNIEYSEQENKSKYMLYSVNKMCFFFFHNVPFLNSQN